VSAARLERLVNLTIALMATPRPLTVADIAASVPGYRGDAADDGTSARPDVMDEAFRRMFERDKEALREQGIPLVAEPVSIWDDNEVGYRIPRQDYYLPDLHLDADEAAALGLAARLWQSASLAEGGASALRKLASTGDVTAAPPAGDGEQPAAPPDDILAARTLQLRPRVATSEPAFEPTLAALKARRAVRFDYLGSRDVAARTRTVEPWGVVSWRGRWYVVGRDRDRDAERVFRLSRVTSAVEAVGPPGSYSPPDGIDLTARVEAVEPPATTGTARVRVPPGSAHALRRDAIAVTPGPAGTDELELPFGDLERLAELLTGAAPEAVALEPPELRDAVVRRLRGALAAAGP